MKNLMIINSLTFITIVSGYRDFIAMQKVKKPRDGMPLNGKIGVVYSSNYQIRLGGLEKLHPFDIHKYARIYKQLVRDSLIKPNDVFVPEPITQEDILLVHTKGFVESLNDSKKVGAYLEAPQISFLPHNIIEHSVLKPFRCSSGGTILASELALKYGIAINLGGGYHHAKPMKGEGFCIYNDIAIAVRKLQRENKIKRALIIDLDVHQGNGTAVCLANDRDAYTFSMHQGNIYPIPKEKSDLDIELEEDTGDEAYLDILSRNLDKLFHKAKPDIVFLQAGCDPLQDDPLASLNMTESGIVKRDAMVIDACIEREIPVIMTLGGGYSKNAWHAQYASIRRIITTYAMR